jgi:hypothetical protein
MAATVESYSENGARGAPAGAQIADSASCWPMIAAAYLKASSRRGRIGGL